MIMRLDFMNRSSQLFRLRSSCAFWWKHVISRRLYKLAVQANIQLRSGTVWSFHLRFAFQVSMDDMAAADGQRRGADGFSSGSPTFRWCRAMKMALSCKLAIDQAAFWYLFWVHQIAGSRTTCFFFIALPTFFVVLRWTWQYYHEIGNAGWREDLAIRFLSPVGLIHNFGAFVGPFSSAIMPGGNDSADLKICRVMSRIFTGRMTQQKQSFE